jgi:hypothetical protein
MHINNKQPSSEIVRMIYSASRSLVMNDFTPLAAREDGPVGDCPSSETNWVPVCDLGG